MALAGAGAKGALPSVLGLGFVSSIIKLLHKREVCYLGFGGVLQLSTQINDIEDSASASSVNGWYRYPAECAKCE